MKRRTMLSLLAVALLSTGCGGTGQEIAEQASGQAEIPREILGSLDEETRQALVEAPKYVALTFDDGPRASTTGPLLSGLAERGVTATFFVIGQQIPGNEDLLRRMKADGHQIGNHTYSHVSLLTTARNAVVEEIQKTEVLLQAALGEGEWWLRPPYGLIDHQRAGLVKTPMIYWTVDPEDWKVLDAAKVVEQVCSRVKPGDIVLLHDFYPTSVDAALEIVDRLQGKGYTFVTVEELFRIQGVTPQTGTLYASPSRTHRLS